MDGEFRNSCYVNPRAAQSPQLPEIVVTAPFPKRLFGTHWCGPGGGGPPVNDLDAAWMIHWCLGPATRTHIQCSALGALSLFKSDGQGTEAHRPRRFGASA
jgi:hypothetical protein